MIVQVPFPYFHLLNLLVLFNLVMISYAATSLACWPLSLLTVICATFVVLGMRTVAIALSDPFGHDLTDFALEPFMKTAYSEAVAQLRVPAYQPLYDTLPTLPRGTPLLDPVFTGQPPTWIEPAELVGNGSGR